jgi:hypothetical protein
LFCFKEKDILGITVKQTINKSPIITQAQADERARRLKEDLERKRQAAYEDERRHLQERAQGKPVAVCKPSPAVPITQVMKAIGAADNVQQSAPSKYVMFYIFYVHIFSCNFFGWNKLPDKSKYQTGHLNY